MIRAPLAVVAVSLVALAVLVPAANAQEPTPGARPLERSQDLARQAAEVRRTRAVVKRILHDRRASEDLKKL